MTRGENLRRGQPHGDRGRRLGGQAHARLNNQPIDDSGRTHAHYWALLGWLQLVQQHGPQAASAIMATRAGAAWKAEMAAFNGYVAHMAQQAGR
jgi:hypothetical protein